MVIRKINVVFMKHSKWLFGIFTVVIIIAFMEFMVPGKFDFLGFGGGRGQQIGVAFGEKVTTGDLEEIQMDFVVLAEFFNNMQIAPPEFENAFYLLCARRAAEARGFEATKKEITDFITQAPVFYTDGKFDYEKYRKQLDTMHRNRGITEDRLYEAVRHTLLRQKLGQEMQLSTAVTPNEVENFYLTMNEKFELKIADFSREDQVAAVKVEPAALKEFFETNRDRYMVPVQLTAQVAVIRFDRPEALKAASGVADEEVRSFYDRNQSAFAGEDGKIKPFDEVKDEARARCIAERVRAEVTREGREFARQAYDRVAESAERAEAFVKAVEQAGYRLVGPATFGADAAAVGEIEEPALVRSLNSVYGVPVTTAVAGKSAVYVGFVLNREEARRAEFNEVARKIQDDFIRERSMALADEAAREAHLKLEGMTPAERLKSELFKRTVDFSISTMMLRPDDQAVAVNCLMLKPGEITQVISTPNGAAIACLEKRTAPDLEGFAATKFQWEMMLTRFKWEVEEENFQQYIARNCQITAAVEGAAE